MDGWHTIDWVVIAVYFGGIAIIGWRSHGRQEDVQDYFLGGRTLPWWAAALSILAILGGLYSLWLLYTGLAPLMGVPEEKAVPYTAVVLLVAVVLMIVAAVVAGLAMPSTTRGF